MQIAVISDLHLGPGDRTDGFGHDDGEFLGFLRFLENNFERIVLLGDIWETLTGARPGTPLRSLYAARRAHPELAARFELPKYHYIHGNHDLVTGVAERAPEKLILNADGTRVLFTHGHQHDWIIRRARWLSELGVWLGSWILRLGLEPLHRVFSLIDGLCSGQASKLPRSSFQRWAFDLAEKSDFDVIVTGHTHIPVRSDNAGRTFLNSGSCAEGRYSFASLDTRLASYAVHSSF